MLEKMKLEKREKRKHILRCIFIAILGIMLAVGYLWIFYNASENLIAKDIDGLLVAILMTVLGAVLLIVIAIGFYLAFVFSKDAKDESIEKIQFNVEVDEFLNYLGNREIQVKLKIGLESLPEYIKDVVKIRKRKFFVRKHGPKKLDVRVFKGGRVVDSWIFDDYEKFFQYFEPIYSKK